MFKEEYLNGQTLLTIEELSKILRIATGSIRNQLCRGIFPINPLKIGHLLRFRSEDVEKYLASQGIKEVDHE
ncbi:MAG TPA: helix-turn-helix domain-containing protein [Deltaproteobacteria bacterium]|nr:helix-turn-helix domain-containing protein [Deltaproteobacteria bacterium]